MRTFIIGVFASILLTACDMVSEVSITDMAIRSDFIVLANVDTNSGAVFYRLERLIINRTGAAFPIASNGVLPGPRPKIEPDTSYGDQALVLLSIHNGRLRDDMSRTFIEGRAVGTDEPLDAVIAKVQRALDSIGPKK